MINTNAFPDKSTGTPRKMSTLRTEVVDVLADSLTFLKEAVEKFRVYDSTPPKPKMTPATKKATALLPGEHQDITIDLKEMLANCDEWLATPNTAYAGRRPQDLIGTTDEYLLRETLRSVVYSGMA